MISFVWSWFSFFAGVLATITAAFWLVVGIAFSQYRKQKGKADALTDALKSWKTTKE